MRAEALNCLTVCLLCFLENIVALHTVYGMNFWGSGGSFACIQTLLQQDRAWQSWNDPRDGRLKVLKITCEPVVTMRSLLGSVFSISAGCRSSRGLKGALPSRCAASRYVVKESPRKQSFLSEASAAFLTLVSLHQHVQPFTAILLQDFGP